MNRDQKFSTDYFNKWVDFDTKTIISSLAQAKRPSGNQEYRPQYVYEIANKYRHLLLRRYCRGDEIRELVQYFPPLLDAWEEAERLGRDVWNADTQYARHAWAVNLDHYIVCFWLTGLALALEIPDAQWERLLALIGNEGQDVLLDRVIASRSPGRKIGTKLCHSKPYQRLLDAINAPREKQAKLLETFVNNWYSELNRPPKKGLSEDTAMYARPYWYKYDTVDGAYFGFWCIEAVAAVRAFGLDDSLCLGHPNYPGDLLRPDGPSTHPQIEATEAHLPTTRAPEEPAQEKKIGLLGRLFGRY